MLGPPFFKKLNRVTPLITRDEAIARVESQIYYSDRRASIYKHLKYVGSLPMAPIADEAKFELLDNQIARFILDDDRNFILSHAGDYVVTNDTNDHLLTSILKIDATPCYQYKHHANFPLSMSFVSNMYDYVFQHGGMDAYDLLVDTTMDASSGFIEQRRGLRTKGDCVSANLPFIEYELDDECSEEPIWKVSGKREFQTRVNYVDNKKQRTFIIQPFKALWNMKREFGKQNNAIKMVGWSFYGFNPYEGGVELLVKHLTSFSNKPKRFWMFDAVRWDRLLPIMSEIWSLRCKYKTMTPKICNIVKYMIESKILTPQGDLLWKDWGNNSGSGTTTGDNILGMSIVVAHVCVNLGIKPEMINHYFSFAIFGDDVVGADVLDLDDETVKLIITDTFSMYGLKLDPLVLTRDITDLEFLGFKICKTELGYIPRYPLGRLCCSFLKNDSVMDPWAEYSKMCSLMMMSAGNGEEVFEFFRRAVTTVVMSVDHPEFAKLRNTDLHNTIPKYSDVINWYLGVEGYSHVGGFYH